MYKSASGFLKHASFMSSLPRLASKPAERRLRLGKKQKPERRSKTAAKGFIRCPVCKCMVNHIRFKRHLNAHPEFVSYVRARDERAKQRKRHDILIGEP